ncbi:MAG: hypothetical protein WC180_03675 [Candidatus Paceibacterota bacterium]
MTVSFSEERSGIFTQAWSSPVVPSKLSISWASLSFIVPDQDISEDVKRISFALSSSLSARDASVGRSISTGKFVRSPDTLSASIVMALRYPKDDRDDGDDTSSIPRE